MLRSYHNKIKNNLINKIKCNTLLDIGSAKGRDFYKWHYKKIGKIYAVDPILN